MVGGSLEDPKPLVFLQSKMLGPFQSSCPLPFLLTIFSPSLGCFDIGNPFMGQQWSQIQLPHQSGSRPDPCSFPCAGQMFAHPECNSVYLDAAKIDQEELSKHFHIQLNNVKHFKGVKNVSCLDRRHGCCGIEVSPPIPQTVGAWQPSYFGGSPSQSPHRHKSSKP